MRVGALKIIVAAALAAAAAAARLRADGAGELRADLDLPTARADGGTPTSDANAQNYIEHKPKSAESVESVILFSDKQVTMAVSTALNAKMVARALYLEVREKKEWARENCAGCEVQR
jgi:hypothetical protein